MIAVALKVASIMADSKPSIPRVGRRVNYRLRLTLAVVGIAVVILSTAVLLYFNRPQPHDQLRYSPPATLLAPPETIR